MTILKLTKKNYIKIQILIFGLIFASTNTYMNKRHTLVPGVQTQMVYILYITLYYFY